MRLSGVSASGFVKALLAAACWGSATVMSKGALDEFAPVTLLPLQLVASVSVLWVAVLLLRPPRPRHADVVKFAWLGLLEPWLAYLLGLIGLADNDASAATLIQSSESVLIIAVSVIVFKDLPRGRLVALSLIALGGLLVALGIADSGVLMAGAKGKLLIFLGTAAAAVYVAVSARFAAGSSPLFIVAWQQSIALVFAIALLPVAWRLRPASTELPSGIGIWLLAIASGIVQYAMAFWLYMSALRTLSANVAGSLLCLIPIFGLAGAFAFLHEEMSPIQLWGAAVTVVAVMLINLGGHEPIREV